MLKTSVRKISGEQGQAILLVVLGMSVFLLGAVGLALDGSHLYAQRQMAQAAADAGAEAGIMSIFDGTSGTGTHAFTASATVTTCGASDQSASARISSSPSPSSATTSRSRRVSATPIAAASADPIKPPR